VRLSFYLQSAHAQDRVLYLVLLTHIKSEKLQTCVKILLWDNFIIEVNK